MKILIADDDLTTRFLLKAILSKFGYEVLEVASGPAAWEHFVGPDPAPLAILDWVMPELDGLALCRQVKARAQAEQPYIILLTSKAAHQDMISAFASGVDDFMVKPFEHEELRARVTVGARIINLRRELCEANEHLEGRVQERTHEVKKLLLQKDEVLRNLSHDLKTPITPLLALLPILVETEPDAERRAMLQLALDGSRNIHELVNRVLELCRAGGSALHSEGSDLAEIVSAALTAFRNTHSLASRSLSHEVPTDCLVQGDPLQVRKILTNLLDNALQFTSSTGRISIRAGPLEGAIAVAISDDGIGLEEAHLPKVFEPFFKADPSRHNRSAAGLGLSITKTLVQHQGGRIWVESPGLHRGATFWFTLPAWVGH
jgi:signal transduction histidine kinase